MLARIGYRSAHGNEPALRIDARIDTRHLPRQPFRHATCPDIEMLIDGEFPKTLLRYREIDAHRLQILKGRDLGARREILAQIHTGDPDHAGEGRIDIGLIQQGDGGGKLCLCRASGGLGFFQRGARSDTAALKLLISREGLIGQVDLRARRLHICGTNTAVQPEKRTPMRHLVIGGEQNLPHDARGLNRQLDALRRVGRPDRLNNRRPCDRLHLINGNSSGRHLTVCKEIRDHLGAEQIEPNKAAYDDGKQDDGNDKSLDHTGPFRHGGPARCRVGPTDAILSHGIENGHVLTVLPRKLCQVEQFR
ncbi:hypothetical protein CG51_12425 [Haematobacter missouriensis]|nr:hypothetical protein CG51_12425 [Haematobacter missouriensis]